jgi:hypothetical protein
MFGNDTFSRNFEHFYKDFKDFLMYPISLGPEFPLLLRYDALLHRCKCIFSTIKQFKVLVNVLMQ